MTDRILDFSQRPAHLALRSGLLRIDWKDDSEALEIPLGEIGAVVLAHREITVTQAALAGLAAALIPTIICDDRFRPVGLMLPIEGHQEQQRRFRAQAALSLPRSKRLWQLIVRAKIKAQAQVLEHTQGIDFGLRAYARRVGSGDTTNVEAQAARRYWASLFIIPEIDAPQFIRSNDEDARNHLLNYGYAVLRSTVTRGLCASGLHPSFGLHHHGPFNTFPLADDLVEPFRTCVDIALHDEWKTRRSSAKEFLLDPASKRVLYGILGTRYQSAGESRTLADWILMSCQSLARCIQDAESPLEIPEWESLPSAYASRTIPNHVAPSNVRPTR